MKKRKGDAGYKYRSFKRKRISITTLERKSYFTHYKVDHIYHSLKTWYAAWKWQLWSALDMSNWETYWLLSFMPHDAGGTWDCFFKSVSHQLYGMEELHFQIRLPEIEHWRGCPEFYIKHFSESTRDNYIHRMQEPGTWCDNIIIQLLAMLTVVLFTSLSLLILNQIEQLSLLPIHAGQRKTIFLGCTKAGMVFKQYHLKTVKTKIAWHTSREN